MAEERYWKSLKEYEGDSELAAAAKDEFPEPTLAHISRRTFIELIGFSAAGLFLSGCRAPEQKIISYVEQPPELTPGVANWYASYCGGCSANCGTLVKVRDGRPIKLEGNPEHPVNGGGLCAIAHALIFGLFDSERLQQPLARGQAANWQSVDNEIRARLDEIAGKGGRLCIVTGNVSSPTTLELIDSLLARFPGGKHIVYQAVSNTAINAAHGLSHGVSATPEYRFDNARMIVSFGADFLGGWLSPAAHTRAYARARAAGGEMARHVQFESLMSLTGSNADERVKVSPAQQEQALLLLASLIARRGRNDQAAIATGMSLEGGVISAVERAAEQLWRHRGRSLVVAGSNDVESQYLVNFINHALENYGRTILTTAKSSRAKDRDFVDLVDEMKAGKVDALIIAGVNPAYSYGGEFISALKQVALKISCNPRLDETSTVMDYVCPHHHFLEAWDDAEPAENLYSICQPAIAPLFNTRSYQESLLRWQGDNRNYYQALREHWRAEIFPGGAPDFEGLWDATLQRGFYAAEKGADSIDGLDNEANFSADAVVGAAARLLARAQAQAEGLSLVLYEKSALRDGTHAGNPWLQELPDPVSKIVWDNYACVSPRLAEKLRLNEGDLVRVTRAAISMELPVHIQPGQHDDCIGVAVGYGRARAGKAGSNVGANAYPFVRYQDGAFRYSGGNMGLERGGGSAQLASTQTHHTLNGREIIKELSLAGLLAAQNGEARPDTEKGPAGHSQAGLWQDHHYGDAKWGIAIDLNACTGCSACVLSCQAENNIPVVGKEEVARQREMHWLRIDRYYKGEPHDPQVAHQPVMCGQCDNAACESVCPVLATVHSSDGLNMQVYNRCVGTRYCANNCAFKSRRFNWFDYPRGDAIATLALNPDVTVRSRGVMEKCTFCVQRIEEVKIRARNQGREIKEGEIQTACQQSCPANAIIFGNLANPESAVSVAKREKRDYRLLDELNLRSSVSYLARVRNNEEA